MSGDRYGIICASKDEPAGRCLSQTAKKCVLSGMRPFLQAQNGRESLIDDEMLYAMRAAQHGKLGKLRCRYRHLALVYGSC
jgi:hypothetical protein